MPVAVTDADTIRAELARQIGTIVPRYAPSRDSRWTWARDGEIVGTLRTFDVVLAAEDEVIGGAYGGGLEYASETEIRVSYPVSEAELPRFVGSDGQDLAAILIRLHTSIPGMFPVSMRGELPVFERVTEGDPGRYTAIFRTRIHFFVSDTVTTDG